MIGLNHPNAMTTNQCFNVRTVSKESLSRVLFDGIKLMFKQQKLIKELRGETQVLMAETINCQSSVIKLQDELISAKNTQVAELKSSVQSTVETAVVKSYSEALNSVKFTSTQPSEGAVLNQETLKSVVKQVVTT